MPRLEGLGGQNMPKPGGGGAMKKPKVMNLAAALKKKV